MVEVVIKQGKQLEARSQKKAYFYCGMQNWHFPQGHQLTHEPGILHTALVWEPEDKAWVLIMVKGQITYPFLKCHSPQMETTSRNEAEKTLAFRRRCNYPSLGLQWGRKKAKSLLRTSNQKPTFTHIGVGTESKLPPWLWKNNNNHLWAESVINAALGCHYPVFGTNVNPFSLEKNTLNTGV